MRRSLVLPAIVLAACSDATSSTPFAHASGTYSEYMIDGQLLPVETPSDTCQYVNLGGWLTLSADGKYSMMLDRTRLMCNGARSGESVIGQTGTYQLASDTVIAFTPAPSYGPPFVATLDPGNYTEEAGGRFAQLRFRLGAHDYWVIEDMPTAQRRR